MPRSRRIVTLCALPAALSDEERVRRTARATAVLLRIAARLDAKAAADAEEDTSQKCEGDRSEESRRLP